MEVVDGARSRPSRSGATCCSPGGSAGTCGPTRSCSRRDLATVGIGAGQMSRVDSVRLAVEKSRVESLQGAVLASDAFFPFSDGPEMAIEAGVTAIDPARRLGARRRGRRGGRRGAASRWSSRAGATSATELASEHGGRTLRLRRAVGGVASATAACVRAGDLVLVAGTTAIDARTATSRVGDAVRAGAAAFGAIERRAGAGRRAAGRRRADADVRDRHRALGGDRPRPRRVLRRAPAGDGDGAGRGADRPADARRDRGDGAMSNARRSHSGIRAATEHVRR